MFEYTGTQLQNGINLIPTYIPNAIGWQSFNANDTYLTAGTEYALLIIIEPISTPVSFNATWTLKHEETGTPSGSSGEAWMSTTGSLRISNGDEGGTDQSANLQAVPVGADISFGGTTYEVLDVAISGWGVTYTVAPYFRPSENDYLFTFNYATATSIDYVVATGQLTANPEARGYLDTGSGKVVQADDGYGTDFVVQDVLLSPDWDIAAFSGSALGGGSGGNNSLDDLVDVEKTPLGDSTLTKVRVLADVTSTSDNTTTGIYKAIDWSPQSIDSITAMFEAPVDKTYIFDQSAASPYDITSITRQTVSGNCLLTVQIDGVNVTGLINLTSDITERSDSASALNSVAIGQRVTVTVSGNNSATDLALTMAIIKT